MCEHSFNTEMAKMVGVNASIIFKHIKFWIDKNKADGTNFHDGEYWTFTSVKALEKIFPYLTTRQIRSSIEKLIESGFIKTGHHNEKKTDRTLWYAIGSAGSSICQKWQMDLSEMTNGIVRNDKCLIYKDKSIEDIAEDITPAKPTKNFNAVETLRSLGCEERTIRDWMIHRKNRKAAITETAINRIISQAGKAEISLNEALIYSINKNWIGFDAEWYLNATKSTPNRTKRTSTYEQTMANVEIARELIFGGIQ